MWEHVQKERNMKDKIQVDIVHENGQWYSYVIIDGKRIWGLGSNTVERAIDDKNRILRGDLHDVIVNSTWYKKAEHEEIEEKTEIC